MVRTKLTINYTLEKWDYSSHWITKNEFINDSGRRRLVTISNVIWFDTIKIIMIKIYIRQIINMIIALVMLFAFKSAFFGMNNISIANKISL